MTPTNERTTIVIEDMFTPRSRKGLAKMVEHEVLSNTFKVSLWDRDSHPPILNITIEYLVHDAISTVP